MTLYRVVTLERVAIGDILQAFLQSDEREAPRYVDIQCDRASTLGKLLIAANTSGHTLRIEIGEQKIRAKRGNQ